MAALQNKFHQVTVSGGHVPRPGTGKQSEFASTERIDRHAALREDFIRQVLNMEWAFISDESSLWDFGEENDNSALTLRIGEVYGVDVSDIDRRNIADILDRIMDEIHDFPEDEAVKYVRLGRDARTLQIMGKPLPPWNDDESV